MSRSTSVSRNRAHTPRRFRTRATVGLVASALAAAGLFAFGAAQAHAGPSDGAKADPGVGASTVPAHAVTGYWQNFDNGATVQKLARRAGAVRHHRRLLRRRHRHAGRGRPSTSTRPWAGGYTVDQFKADIEAKQAAGKSVIISVGGEKGTVSVNDDASATAFADSRRTR